MLNALHLQNWKKSTATGIACICLGLGTCIAADEDASMSQMDRKSLWNRESLTNNWFGTGEYLDENGISLGLGLTQTYQRNVHDGLESGIGRQSGSYDLELELDMEKLSGLKGGSIFVLGEGSWSGGDGIDSAALGESIFGVNDDFGGERSLDITELWYQQNFLDNSVKIRIGKLDLSGGFEHQGIPAGFDGNRYANDETAQFLNGALVNNPTIPFPDNGLGIMFQVSPLSWWYMSGGVADAKGDARTTGFNTAFDGEHDYFYIAETGFTPSIKSKNGKLPGTYRFGVWHERVPKQELEGGDVTDDDIGFYINFDQKIYRENSQDMQGLGLFARAGWTDDDVNTLATFFGGGMQYRGFIPGRDRDDLGIGAAYGDISDNSSLSANYESAVEIYYNVQVTPWLEITPDIQWISNAGGEESGGDAVVTGLRLQLKF